MEVQEDLWLKKASMETREYLLSLEKDTNKKHVFKDFISRFCKVMKPRILG